MIAFVLSLLLQASSRPRVTAIRTETIEGRPALRIQATRPLTEARVRREAAEIRLFLDADAAPGLQLPPAPSPLTALRLQTQPGGGLTLFLGLPAETPYEFRRDESSTLILFGPRRTTLVASPSRPDVVELYKKILPPPPPEGGEGESTAGVQVVGTAESAADARRDGFYLGPLGVRPSVNLTYVDAEGFLLDTPQPVRDRYFEVQPRLAFDLELFKLRLLSDYSPRFRFGSAFSLVEQTTHAAELQLEGPVGPAITIRGGARYARGTLEAQEVDPGREFFFQLGRYTHQSYRAGVRIQTGSLVDLDLSGALEKVQVDDQSGFFDHENRSAEVAAAYEVGPDLRAFLGYSYGEIPFTAERPEVQSTWHQAQLRLTGEILPLVDGELIAGYRTQHSPRAASGGTRYRGPILSARLSKAFAADSRLAVQARRSTNPSAFEGNAFYVLNSVQADLTAPLPFELALHGAAGYHRNDYRTVAAGLGEPRRDRIYAWSVGLGRPFTRRAFLRADYRKERRDSNLDAFDSRSQALTVQLGIGLFRSAEER